MNKAEFWKNKQKASNFSIELKGLKEETEELAKVQQEIKDFKELVDILDDDKMNNELQDKYQEIKSDIELLKTKISEEGDKYDKSNAIIQISSGTGGLDAQDWGEMLFRMYLRYVRKEKLKAQIISLSRGAEQGLKTGVIEVFGANAYKKLKLEHGVHRLVRISPFNANNLRQTSFALVEVTPEINSKEIEIDNNNLKIDTFKSQGAGGQHVNTTDSAVRITHIPTGIVVSCQSERSQLQNKEKAKKVLQGKLYILNEMQKKEKAKEIRGEHKKAQWGSQIRSYVLHPYKMVKDHITGTKTSKVEEVLNGNLKLIRKER